MKPSSLKYFLFLGLLALGNFALASNNENEESKRYAQAVAISSGSQGFTAPSDGVVDFIKQEIFEIPTEREWKEKVSPVIKRSYELLGSGNNVATFRLKVTTNVGTAFKDFSKFLFVSGGNKEAVKSLEKQVDLKSYCIYDFYPPVPNQPQDKSLREEISNFFDFEEDTPENLEGLKSSFLEFISKVGSSQLEEGLKRDFQITFENHVTLRTFQAKNKRNLSVRDLSLCNTTREGNQPPPDHINDVFGDNFQLNFTDSEQSIRAFMRRAKKNVNLDGQHIDFALEEGFCDSFLDVNSKAFLFCKDYEEKFDALRSKNQEILKNNKKLMQSNLKKEKDSSRRGKIMEKYNNLVKELSSQEDTFFEKRRENYYSIFNHWIAEKGISFELELFSYYQMCQNCQATFRYDFDYKHLFQRDILVSFLSGLKDGPIKNCFKTLLLTKSFEGINFPKTTLNVHFLEKYGESDDK